MRKLFLVLALTAFCATGAQAPTASAAPGTDTKPTISDTCQKLLQAMQVVRADLTKAEDYCAENPSWGCIIMVFELRDLVRRIGDAMEQADCGYRAYEGISETDGVFGDVSPEGSLMQSTELTSVLSL